MIFQLCPANDPEKEASEDCLNDNNLEVVRDKRFVHLKAIIVNNLDDDSSNDLKEEDSYESYDSLEIDNRLDLNLDANKLIETIKRPPNLFNPVDLDDHTFDKFKYFVPMERPKSYDIQVKLPNNINCRRCVFRWIYASDTY